MKRKLGILTALVLIALGVGTTFYQYVEGLDWFDSLYLSVITLTTVGYGDVVPVTFAGKLFTIFYVFIGIGIIFGFIRAIASERLDKNIFRHKIKEEKLKQKIKEEKIKRKFEKQKFKVELKSEKKSR